jgi:hypothetical protein
MGAAGWHIIDVPILLARAPADRRRRRGEFGWPRLNKEYRHFGMEAST